MLLQSCLPDLTLDRNNGYVGFGKKCVGMCVVWCVCVLLCVCVYGVWCV